MKKWISLCLVVLLFFSLTVTAFAYGDKIRSGADSKTGITVTLTKVGQTDAEPIEDAVCEAAGIIEWDGGMAQLLNDQGKPVGEQYDNIEPLCKGYWLVYLEEKGINCCGLMKDDGTLLIPPSAAIIDAVAGPTYEHPWEAELRYLEVVYATEELSDDDDAYLTVWYTPYAGYSLYYDLEQERFVGDLRRDSADESVYSIHAVGDKLFFEDRATVYNEKGEVVLQDDKLRADRDHFVRSNEDDFSVLDSELKEVARFPLVTHTFPGEDQFFILYEDDWYWVVDPQGEQVGEMKFYLEPDAWGNFFYGDDEDDYMLVMDRDGKPVITPEDKVTYIETAPYGFLLLTVEGEDGDEYALLCPDGEIVRGLDEVDPIDGLLALREDGESTRVLVLDDKDFSMKLPEDATIEPLTYEEAVPVLAVIEDWDGMMTLVNLVNGEKLMKVDCGDTYYEGFCYANGYLYVLDSDNYVYEIYKVEIEVK